MLLGRLLDGDERFVETVYERSSSANAKYNASIHLTEAIVVEAGRPTAAALYEVVYSTDVQWLSGGRNRTATVEWPLRARAGDTILVSMSTSALLLTC